MTKLILIRHGQSASNLSASFAGQQNYPLTDLGKKQAALVADYLQNFPIDAIYASDLQRAFNTVAPLGERLHIKPQPNKNLREIFAGEWEGKTYQHLIDTFPNYQIWMNTVGQSRCDGGESVAELSERILSTLWDIVKKHPGQTVVIGTHATPVRCVMCKAGGIPVAEMHRVPWVGNASCTFTEWEEADGSIRVTEGNVTSYLKELATFIPAGMA